LYLQKIWKENNSEMALMVFSFFENNHITYEFHLVKFFDDKNEVLKKKEYRDPLNKEEIAKDFGVKPEDVKELLEELGYKI
jgi:hypothetical protein